MMPPVSLPVRPGPTPEHRKQYVTASAAIVEDLRVIGSLRIAMIHSSPGEGAPDCKLMLEAELFAQDAFVEIMTGVEQHVERYRMIHADIDAAHRTHLVVVGDGRHRALFGLHHLDGDDRLVRQQRATPAPRPERADRRER